MMTLIGATVSLLFLLAFMTCVAWGIITWIRRRRYTRERFAFFAFAGWLALAAAAIATVAGRAPVWQQVLVVVHYIRTGEILETSLDPVLAALIVVTVLVAAWLAYMMFRSWDGQTSESTYRARQVGKNHPLNEAVAELQRLLSGAEPFRPFSPVTLSQRMPDLSEPPPIAPWRERACWLLTMRRAYDFGEDPQWHGEHEFWLARHADHGRHIAIKCSTERPSEHELEAFADYVKKMNPGPCELVVAVQDGVGSYTATIGVHTFELVSRADMLDGLVNVAEYRSELRRRVRSEKLPGSDLELEQTYVSMLFDRESSSKPEDLASALHTWVHSETLTQLALLGEYGQGKSTVALMLAHRMLEQNTGTVDGRIPLLIELRGKSPSNLTPGELLSAWGYRYGLEGRRLLALHEAGKLLLIFDGFDEMAFVGSPEQRLRHFQTLWSLSHANAKIIITGRPNLFLDDTELKAALGIRQSASGGLNCEAWSLRKFTPGQIAESLRAWPEEVQKGITQAVASNPRLLDIAGRPSLLHVLAVLWRDKKLPSDVERLTSAEVMRCFVDATLQRQADKAIALRRQERARMRRAGATPEDYMVLNAAERRYFMLGIAVHMILEGETNQIRAEMLNDITVKLARICPDSLSVSPGSVDEQARDPIRVRMGRSPDFLGRLFDDVRTSGLLVRDPSAQDVFQFGHKSFMEYLAADYAERAHAGVRDEEMHSIATLAEAPVKVLRTSVTRGYFGELLVARRTPSAVGLDDPAVAARLLLALVVRSRLRRAVWRVAARGLRHHERRLEARGITGIVYRLVAFPVADAILDPFSARRMADPTFAVARRRARLYLMGALAASLFTIIGVTSVWLSFVSEAATLGGNVFESRMLRATIVMVIGSLLTHVGFLIFNAGMPLRRMARVWVQICKERGYQVATVYEALAGVAGRENSYHLDPCEIYAPDSELLTMEDSELRQHAVDLLLSSKG